MKGGNQESGYFEIERPRFTFVQGPAWLNLDEATGLLSGTPADAGAADVSVVVTIERQVRQLDESRLVWGQEVIVSEDTERVGEATQKFVIQVQ
jgi:hypothetical protein